jgi:hypothetical protein
VLELEPFSLFTSNRTELVVDDNKMPAMTGHRLLFILFQSYFIFYSGKTDSSFPVPFNERAAIRL